MTYTKDETLEYLNNQQDHMVEQLHQFCSINSGSDNLEGLGLMHQRLSGAFESLADEARTIPSQPLSSIDMNGDACLTHFGSGLFLRKRPELKSRVLLMGHMDTVYPANSTFQNLTYLNDNHLQGPGVADMKGGLVILLHALRAFEKAPVASNIGWDVFINADEEVGSLGSSYFMEQISRDYLCALIYEPAMNREGLLAKNRRGKGMATIIAEGRAAHAGRAFEEGRNAICYLAEVIIAIHALNGQRPGVSINVGKVSGGSALNVVPEKAVVKLDVRIAKKEDEQWFIRALENILKQLQRKDYSLFMEQSFDRPIKEVNEGTRRLFKQIQVAGLAIGLDIHWADSGGCCDGNNLAQYGLPVIDTLGVRGGLIHSFEEFVLLDSLVERAALSTLVLMDLAGNGL